MSTTFISAQVPMLGSNYNSKTILLFGRISVVTLLLVVVVISIRGAIIIKTKKLKGNSGINLIILV